MKLHQKIKSYFKNHDFRMWKDLRFEPGSWFSHPTEEILIEIASRLRDMDSCVDPEDARFRMKEKNCVKFGSLDALMPWLSKILKSDFEETSGESEVFGWKFRYQMKPHPASPDSMCLSNTLTSVKKQNSHCIYTLVSIRKFGGSYYCWTF